MYLFRNVGYSADTATNDLGFTDYVPFGSVAYSVNYINTNDGRIDYLIDKLSYSDATIDTRPILWNIWTSNWETVVTNWENL